MGETPAYFCRFDGEMTNSLIRNLFARTATYRLCCFVVAKQGYGESGRNKIGSDEFCKYDNAIRCIAAALSIFLVIVGGSSNSSRFYAEV